MIVKVIAAAATVATLLLHLVGVAGAEAKHLHHAVPAIYVFGDSLLDVGNNNYLPGGVSTKGNYPHYGIDYPGGKPTGRFCNGYLAVDFLAQKLGFKESPPAALSVNLSSPAQTVRGLNFASGGAGVLDSTRPNISLSLNAQIALFKGVVSRLAAAEGSEATRRRLSKSLFVVSAGSNDLSLFFAALGSQNASSAGRFVSSITVQLGNQLKALYGLGARRFVVFGTTRIGCVPAIRELDPNGGCIDYLNNLSAEYSAALKRELLSIASSPGFKGFRYSYTNMDGIFAVIVNDPTKFGFKETAKACCGDGRFGATLCLPNATYCSNRDEYVVWDWGGHPTQATYKIIANWAYSGPRVFAQPVNIHSLLK